MPGLGEMKEGMPPAKSADIEEGHAMSRADIIKKIKVFLSRW